MNKDLYELAQYDFDLPPGLIAQVPLLERSSSKLLVYNKNARSIIDSQFLDVRKFLPQKSVLVFNNSKVYKARVKFLHANKFVEVFFLNQTSLSCEYDVLCKPAKYFKLREQVVFPDGVRGVVVKILDDGVRRILIENCTSIEEFLDKYGEIPLPPYIKSDKPELYEKRYQTVYAKEANSVAAPTAGLHFTPELIDDLKGSGVEVLEVTLAVGLGTFLPVRVSNILEHKMHAESFYFSENVAKKLNELRFSGYKIIPVGTTSLRVLESCFDENDNLFRSKFGETDIFIYPGVKTHVDGLITNFHLPKSTLFMLISALIGLDEAKRTYAHAVENKYRFFSFGDACLFLL